MVNKVFSLLPFVVFGQRERRHHPAVPAVHNVYHPVVPAVHNKYHTAVPAVHTVYHTAVPAVQ